MKGQVFIIALILILIILVLLKSETKSFPIQPESPLYKDFSNLKNELVETVDLSIFNGDDISTNLNSFITFSKEIFERKGYKQTVSYTILNPGNTMIVYMNVSLELDDSYLKDSLIINRTVYI